MAPGFTLWLTGLPGAGKSTLARRVRDELAARGRPVELLDGDEVRATLSKDLGYSRSDREAHVERIAYVARLLSRNGIAVIVAAIAPYRELRQRIRSAQQQPFCEIYLECPLEELVRRDPKGLYARALRGELSNFTGVSDPYEPPLTPEVHVRSDRESPDEAAAKVLAWLERQSLVERSPASRS